MLKGSDEMVNNTFSNDVNYFEQSVKIDILSKVKDYILNRISNLKFFDGNNKFLEYFFSNEDAVL